MRHASDRRVRQSAGKLCRSLLVLSSLIGSILIPTVFTSELRADSLWKKRDAQSTYLTRDSRAREVGDLITIEISESSEVDNSEDKSLNKGGTSSVNGDFNSSSGGGLKSQSSNASLDMSTASRRSFQGTATYKDSREFTDTMTVTVVDVLPNGNMVVAGRRSLMIAGEERTLAISGVVRPIDLGPDNRINSRYVADLRTVFEGDGPSRRYVRQGWVSKAMNKVWPF